MMKKNKEKKICFICSSGGHFSEMYCLKKITSSFDSFLVTEKVDNFETDFCDKKYFIREINRKENFFIFHFFIMCLKLLYIFIKENPNYIVTTGALCSYPMAKIAKFFKRKVIYIESYARVYSLSVTGTKMYQFADLFIVQWEELAQKYPKSIFIGNLFGV